MGDEPCIIRVKGEGPKLNLKEMPYRMNSLNDGDAFIIDFGYCLYQWNGIQSSAEEKDFATKLAKGMLSERKMSREKFIQVESSTIAPLSLRESIYKKVSVRESLFGSSASLNQAKSAVGSTGIPSDAGSVVTIGSSASSPSFNDDEASCRNSLSLEEEKIKEEMLFELLPDSKASFFGLIKQKLSIKTANRAGKDENQSLRKKKLFNIRLDPSGIRFVLLNRERASQHPNATLSSAAFNMQEQFLLDTGLHIYIWVGSWCNPLLAEGIAQLYKQKYFKRSKRPFSIPVTVIRQGKEGAESEFAKHFQISKRRSLRRF